MSILKKYTKTPLEHNKRFLILLINLIFVVSNLYSQTEVIEYDSNATKQIMVRSDWYYGCQASLQLNYHTLDLTALPGVPSCCPNYKKGLGFEPLFGVFFNYSLSEKKDFLLGVRLYYSNFGAVIKANEWQLMDYGPNESVKGLIEHNINTSINAINIEPMFIAKVANDVSFSIGLTLNTIFSTYFKQKETLLEPEDLLFENDKRVRMTYRGNIPGVSNYNYGVTAGINYDILKSNDRDWYLSPEINYFYGFRNIISYEKWNVQGIKLGVAFVFNERKIFEYQIPPEEIIDTSKVIAMEKYRKEYLIDTIKTNIMNITDTILVPGPSRTTYDTLFIKDLKIITEKYFRTDTLKIPVEYEFAASVKAFPIDEEEKEIPLPEMISEEYLTTRMHPLLNYVFFEENSAEIPARYKKMDKSETEKFNLDGLYNLNSLQAYHYILNIIGLRLNEYPNAKLTLIGSMPRMEGEQKSTQLSLKRAEAIKNYLTDIWKIQDNRISIKTKDIPLNKSNRMIPEVVEENRRVEIYSNQKEILFPVITNDTLTRTSIAGYKSDSTTKQTIKGLRIVSSVKSSVILKEWNISILQGKDTLRELSGKGAIPDEHEWFAKSDNETNKIFSEPLKIVLSIVDSNGKSLTAEDSVRIKRKSLSKKQENRESDKKIDGFSLILFDLQSFELTENNKDIPKFIGRLFDNKSKIKVLGYSDRLGNDTYNKTLAERRAETVANAIGHPDVIHEGIGETILLYNNDLPEGRFYCRTVDIIVETTIHW